MVPLLAALEDDPKAGGGKHRAAAASMIPSVLELVQEMLLLGEGLITRSELLH